jgi:hypothetical protein
LTVITMRGVSFDVRAGAIQMAATIARWPAKLHASVGFSVPWARARAAMTSLAGSFMARAGNR